MRRPRDVTPSSSRSINRRRPTSERSTTATWEASRAPSSVRRPRIWATSTASHPAACGTSGSTWRTFARWCRCPLLAKGILTADGARRCLDLGYEGIVVSNHGGTRARLRALHPRGPHRGRRCGSKAVSPVLIDSGFRRGVDVLKALALGADAVCLGRVPRWGLGAFGTAGAQRVLEIVRAELAHEMAAVGRAAVQHLDRDACEDRFSMSAGSARLSPTNAPGPWRRLLHRPVAGLQRWRPHRSAVYRPAESSSTYPSSKQWPRWRVSPAAFRKIAGGDRAAFDRMTFRQRLMVKATELDLSTELFGRQDVCTSARRPGRQVNSEFHPDGELETARGAAAARGHHGGQQRVERRNFSDRPRSATTPLWFQVYSDDAKTQIAEAIDAGVTAVVITVRRPSGGRSGGSIDDRLVVGSTARDAVSTCRSSSRAS